MTIDIVLNLGIPVLVIVALLRLFKISWPAALFVIAIAAMVATCLVDYVHCVLLNKPCIPDALDAIGYFLYWFYVFTLAAIMDYLWFCLFSKTDNTQ